MSNYYPESKTKPWDHQVTAFNLARNRDGFALFHDMGTGKSKTAIDILNDADARCVLILCPLSVVSVWPTQFEKHSYNDYRVVELSNGSVAKKAKTVQFELDMHKKIGNRLAIIVNYESAWRWPLGPKYGHKITPGSRRRVLEEPGALLSTCWDFVILDESHKIKSPSGETSKFCTKLRECAKQRLCLTGTPMPHTPLDIFAQYRFLDPTIFGEYFVNFRNLHMIMKEFMVNGFTLKQFKAVRDPELFHKKVYSVAHRVKKSDVLDLPPMMHETRHCTLEPKAMKAYLQLEHNLYVEVENGEITVANALVKLLRLQQLTGGWLSFDDGGMEQLDKSKVMLYTDMVEDIGKEPTVTFCKFRADIESCKQALEESGRGVPAELSGKRNDLDAWQRGDHLDIVVQIQAGGLGVDLTRAAYVIYFSKGFSLGDYEQSLARAHRPGQTRPVLVIHLESKGTVDEKVARALAERKDVVEAVLGMIKKGGRS